MARLAVATTASPSGTGASSSAGGTALPGTVAPSGASTTPSTGVGLGVRAPLPPNRIERPAATSIPSR